MPNFRTFENQQKQFSKKCQLENLETVLERKPAETQLALASFNVVN